MCSSKVSSYLNLSDITLHLAVCLFDRTLAVAELDEKQLQMTAITCLHIASKVMVITVTDFVCEQIFANISAFFIQVEEDFVPAPSLLLPLLGGSEVETELENGRTERKEEALKTRMVEMARTERMILKTLNFHLRKSTAATFLHYFTQVGKEKTQKRVSTILSSQLLPQEARRVGRLAKAILDLSLLSPW